MDLSEFTGDMGGVTIQDRAISVLDLTWVVHDDDLGQEVLDFSWWVILSITTDISSLDVLDGKTFDVESDVVPGNSFRD